MWFFVVETVHVVGVVPEKSVELQLQDWTFEEGVKGGEGPSSGVGSAERPEGSQNQGNGQPDSRAVEGDSGEGGDD